MPTTITMKRAALAVTAAATLILLSACGAASDRESGSGDQPDKITDTTNVIVYRNADKVPNVATFCAGAYAFVSTLSATDAGENKPATLLRFPELDAGCPGGKAG